MIIIKAEHAKTIQNFISNEEARYYLNGFNVEPNPNGGASIIATDGHVMGVIHDTEGRCDNSAIIQLNKEMVKACKAGREVGQRILVIDPAENQARVVLLNEEGPEAADIPPKDALAVQYQVLIDATFPDWERVLPLDVSGDAANYSHVTVAKFVKARKELNGDKSFRITSNGTSPGIVQFSGNPEFFGVIMPMRGDDFEPVLPRWLKRDQAEAA